MKSISFLVIILLGVALFTTVSQTNILTLNTFISSHKPHILLAVGLPLGLYFTFDKECNCKKMNWKQLFALATPEERIELLALMFHTIEARQNKLVIANRQLIRERRGAFRGAHFLNDKRRRLTPRHVYLSTFMLILATMSIGVWISIFHLPPAYAAPLMFAHLAALGAILTIKPYKSRLQLSPA
jgi:hypothetical protein